jgi:CRP-like cAMP-binding protein
MGRKEPPRFNPKIFLAKVSNGKTMLTSPKRQIIFSQGDAADAVFYIQEGRIKLSTLSQEGKEAVVAILEPGNFLGEGCLSGGRLNLNALRAASPTTCVWGL